MEDRKETSFCVRIAGVTIRVFPVTRYISEFFKDYLVDEQTDNIIVTTKEDIIREREQTTDKKEMARSDRHFEKTALCRKLTSLLLEKYDTLLIHGSCIAVDGMGYLFSAPSRTGKSTHTRLWREMLGDRVVMVNDDKPFVKITTEGITVCGSPWQGYHDLGENIAVPLKAICFMSRSKTNHIEPLSAHEALPILLGQVYRPHTATEMERTLALVQQLCERVSFYALSCNMKREAARMAYEAMIPSATSNSAPLGEHS